MSWSELERTLGAEIGQQLRLEALKLYDEVTSTELWDNPELRAAVKALGEDLGYLALQHAQGVDVTAEVAQVRAQAACWAFVAAAGVRKGLLAAVERVAKRCGKILAAALVAVVAGALA